MKCSIDYSKIWKGGDTMRLAVLLALAGIMLASMVCAEDYTEVLYPSPFPGYTGENWIAMRSVPFDPNPEIVFGDLSLIDDGRLQRRDPVTGNLEGFISFEPEVFGGMLLGDGYKVYVQDGLQHTITYSGAPAGLPDGVGQLTDMWISLPGQSGMNGGMHWVGFPFNHPVLWTNVLVTDGTQTVPVLDAVNLGWLQGYWQYMDAPTQNLMQVDPDELSGSAYLEPGRTYEVITMKSNLALIIPAN